MSGNKEKDEGDYLGYGVYADTLWNRIQAALDKDLGSGKALGDDPLVVGIFGEWGAGKSTLLKLVRHRAEAAAEQANNAQENVLTVPVYFQPWKYEHEKHLLVPLVLHVVEAAREALKKSPTVRQQLAVLSKDAEVTTWKWGRRAHESAKTARKWFPVVKKIVGSLSVFGVSIALPDEIDDWLKDAEAVFESPEAKEQQRRATAQELRAKKLSFVDNGFHYYELHELLTALTRPGKTADTEDLTAQGAPVKNLRINFVIFIDDLDRCLPEKAVETLELIKTVFNLESFAFVLALDEEVVERGIGHRYAAYALAGKKPEMPITGFEYLEKIVHLPFRLPALSRQEGLTFLEAYERRLLEGRRLHPRPGYEPLPWFSKRDVAITLPDKLQVHSDPMAGARGAAEAAIEYLSARIEMTASGGMWACHLGHAALNAFDAYVPRKLIRVVELFHQVVEVAHERGRPVDAQLGGERDPRWVLVFVMLQLFQPDLFRLLRRLGRGVDTLRDAFAEKSLRADMADMELLNWACYAAKPIPTDLQAATAAIANHNDEGVRYPAQRIRLPIVERLLEHRAAQRHVFDPLKLFAGLMDPRVPFSTGSTRAYFSLLSRVAGEPDELRMLDVAFALEVVSNDEKGVAGSDDTAEFQQKVDQKTRLDVDLEKLFLSVISAEASERRGLAEALGLQPGQRLRAAQTQELARRLKAWLSEATALGKVDRLARASDGLSYLAPFVAAGDGQALWKALGEPDVQWEPEAPYTGSEALKKAANSADLFVALCQDNRFDPQRLHLPKSRLPENANDSEREPIPGFVRVFEADEESFQPFEGRSVILKPYYLARYLTTVDQYAHFMEAGGYGDPEAHNPGWWDALGWQWRTGQWDSQVKEKVYREHLARRKPEWRGEPMQWAEQQAHGSRPVMQINWFEARAYANWLSGKLRTDLDRVLPGYAVRLPTEAQWERAARAKDATSADDRQYPWGGTDEETAHLHANIGASDIGRPSPVGLFAPNPLGLCDLSGNVWEWQNNLYRANGEGQDTGLTSDVDALKTGGNWEKSDLPALRGGAWDYTAEYARASIRGRVPPVNWGNNVGFRVVLSLAG